MEDNKDLDQLFGFDEENLVKVAKRKSTTKMAGISIGMSLLIIVLVAVLKIQVTPFILDKESSEISYYYNTHGANIFLGGFTGKTKLTNNTVSATKYKVINNIPVYIGEVIVPNNKYEHNFYMNTGEIFSNHGHRVMQFFHPNINYKTYADDLARLEELKEDSVVELGISLDKTYSFEEVEKMMPEGVELNWCWVDGEDETSFDVDEEFFDSDYAVYEEDQLLGFSTIEGNGDKKLDPVGSFIESLELILPKTKEHKKELRQVMNELSRDTGVINPEEVPIIGAVVVGNASDLKALRDIKEIKASSFGVILK